MDIRRPKIVAHAVDLAGGPVAMARFCTRHDGRRVSYQGVQKWLATNRVPGERCLGVAQATDWRVTPHDLRPDIFPTGVRAWSA